MDTWKQSMNVMLHHMHGVEHPTHYSDDVDFSLAETSPGRASQGFGADGFPEMTPRTCALHQQQKPSLRPEEVPGTGNRRGIDPKVSSISMYSHRSTTNFNFSRIGARPLQSFVTDFSGAEYPLDRREEAIREAIGTVVQSATSMARKERQSYAGGVEAGLAATRGTRIGFAANGPSLLGRGAEAKSPPGSPSSETKDYAGSVASSSLRPSNFQLEDSFVDNFQAKYLLQRLHLQLRTAAGDPSKGKSPGSAAAAQDEALAQAQQTLDRELSDMAEGRLSAPERSSVVGKWIVAAKVRLRQTAVVVQQATDALEGPHRRRVTDPAELIAISKINTLRKPWAHIGAKGTSARHRALRNMASSVSTADTRDSMVSDATRRATATRGMIESVDGDSSCFSSGSSRRRSIMTETYVCCEPSLFCAPRRHVRIGSGWWSHGPRDRRCASVVPLPLTTGEEERQPEHVRLGEGGAGRDYAPRDRVPFRPAVAGATLPSPLASPSIALSEHESDLRSSVVSVGHGPRAGARSTSHSSVSEEHAYPVSDDQMDQMLRVGSHGCRTDVSDARDARSSLGTACTGDAASAHSASSSR